MNTHASHFASLQFSDGRADTEIAFHLPSTLTNSAMVRGASRKTPSRTPSSRGLRSASRRVAASSVAGDAGGLGLWLATAIPWRSSNSPN
jgi:hypothetical protein